MSSQSRLEVKGQSPFKQSGVYEAQIAITDSKPSDDALRKKQFSSLEAEEKNLKKQWVQEFSLF